MAKGTVKSPTKGNHSKTESKPKSQNKRLNSYINNNPDENDQDQMEFKISPINPSKNYLSQSLEEKNEYVDNPNIKHISECKNEKKYFNCPGGMVDKRTFTNIVKDAFLSNGTYLDTEIINSDAKNNDNYDNIHNICNDPEVHTEPLITNSTSKIKAKRSYQSILSFFKRSDTDEETKETISLQNIEAISPVSESNVSTRNMENYFNRMNVSQAHNKSSLSRTNSLNCVSNSSSVQSQIIAMIHQFEAECTNLEKKIYLLETNYLSQSPDSTGLTRGWNRCGILSNSSNLLSNSFNAKNRKLSSCRKSMSSCNLSEILASDRLFSLTNYATKLYSDLKHQGSKDKS
ncbi:hypothetical protein BmR1_04g05557 [Babesia microti strain RI]|uniref:Uncharacterized protein n=1 Tax=Babesia microti (strain RI) TaxID=1133968 RepID=A0A1N6LXH6_BABMR|nr:hypothetical protein BmR1_04g05557 [Babesia microti strain RI]SIO73562.1 hypothetical protein BmR1_04g05557 [Babesia microti strain RI]|eukprot:XP_021337650.1 hypothetical protein BmR1_04g05557 [Babesia microti strain RI]